MLILPRTRPAMSGGMYQLDGGGIIGGGGGGGIIKTTKVPSVVASSIPLSSTAAAVNSNMARLPSANASAQHAAAAKHAAVVAHLTGKLHMVEINKIWQNIPGSIKHLLLLIIFAEKLT